MHLQGRVQDSAEEGACSKKRFYLHRGMMGPEPHLGELTSPYLARPENKSGTAFLLMAQCFQDVNSSGMGRTSRFWQ